MRWFDDIIDSIVMTLSKLWEMAMDWEAWCAVVHGGHKESDKTQQLNKISVSIKKNFAWDNVIQTKGRRPKFDPWVQQILWRKQKLPNPEFLPVEFHGQRSLVGFSPWSCKESDVTELPTFLNAQNCPSQVSTVHELRTSRCSSWIQKRQRNQKSNCQHIMDHSKSKRVPEKQLLLLYLLCQSL